MIAFRKYMLVCLMAAGFGAGALAAHADDGCGPMGTGASGTHRMSPEGRKEYFDKRQAQLHDKLKLNANQEGAWNAYVAKIRPADLPKRTDRAELDKLPTPERIDKLLGYMKDGEKRLTDRAAATKEFYAVLTPEQQKIFDQEFSQWLSRGRHRHGPY